MNNHLLRRLRPESFSHIQKEEFRPYLATNTTVGNAYRQRRRANKSSSSGRLLASSKTTQQRSATTSSPLLSRPGADAAEKRHIFEHVVKFQTQVVIEWQPGCEGTVFLRTSRKLPWVGMEAAQHAALKAEVERLLVEWKVLE